MNFYGIIGFNFFKNYDTFVLDTIKMKILLNWNEDGINTEDPNYDNIEYEKQKGNGEQDQKEHEYYKINLYDYFNNIKYFNIYVDNHLYKGIVDTGTLNTILLNNSNIYNTTTDYNNKDTKTSIIIESVLKNKYKVNKTNINHINIITKDNHKIPVELNKYIYSGNLEYINKDVILLGLDFLLNKKLIFDLKNNILIIPKKYLNNTNEFNKKYDALNIGITNVQENQKSQNDNGNNHMDQIKIEDKCKEIYNQLKAKELNFVRITKELENDNVYMKDCKSTNDVIHKYAIKLLYGSNYLKKNDKNIEYEKRYNEVTEFFKKLNNEEKQNMLNKIVNSVLLLKRNDTIHDNNNNNNIINHQKQHSSNQGYEKASDIIHKFVNYEINNNVYSLHKFKSSNVNKNNPKSEEEEYKFLCNLYETHPEYSFEMLNDFKKELSSKKIPYNDCNDEKDIIKKVAHSRVFNNHKNNNKRKNVIVRKYSDDGNNIHTQIIIRGNGLNNNNNTSDDQDQNDYQYNNLDRMDDLFPNSIFSGLLKNFFIQNNNNNNNDGDGDYSSESFDQQNSSDDNQNDLFSELNNFFGFGNLADGMFGRKKKKKVLGFKTKEPQANLENNKENADDNITQAIKQEKDVDIIYLLNKVQKLNDINLKNFILQSLNNQNIRKILVDAVKKGYTNTYEQCKKENDNKSMLNKNVFSIFKKYNSSYICFDENKQNLKKFCNIKNIELRKNVHTNKTEIFIDDKILLTNRKNVFSLKNEDLCLLIKLEILRNKNNMDVLKTPITLCVNNLIDFVNLKEHNMLPKNYDHKYNNKGDNKYNNKGDNKYNNKGDSEYNKCDSEYNKCDSEYNKCDSEYNKCDSEYNKCDSEYNNKGDNKYNNKDYSEYNKGDHFNYHNYINNNNKERILYFFEIERTLMEKKIYENFINDLIFYTNNNEEHAFNMHKNSLHDLKKKTIHLPNCLNYINKYNINNNLYQEQKYIYNKFINLFEHIHNIKLNRANHFETPEQNFDVQEKIQKLIKNMNNSEIFLFYKCTQYLNSFIFTYLFLNRYINYKDVYRYCNLEYIYQFFKWGYVYDVNIMKDANTLLMLSSLRLINKMIQ
ncbi:hypothetical protein PFDG_00689 [Plasmodium falciparum Dd2]|uniref:Uncharacterized protein n=1 Tax=Plasmodium falciparum (isolate Dd2) TaxID=57267 RepID=A0A0L7M5W1_PLAF4|nr:hypothetical protein PFDG_00689 [Plasmodium falciparum Dd2]